MAILDLDTEKVKSLNLELDPTIGLQSRGVADKVDDESSEAGGDDSGGASSLSVEQISAYREALLLQQLRQGEKQFGLVPFTDDPSSVLSQQAANSTAEAGEQPRQHPLLKDSQQFSGVDPKLTAIPVENTEAIQKYPQLRLQCRLRKQLSQGHSPTLSPY